MKRLITMLVVLVGFMPMAYADNAAAPAASAHAGGGMSSLIMFGALFVMMYFLMIRPQSKKAKEHRDMLARIKVDDEVVTQGGLLGRISKDAGSFFIITLSEGVEVAIQKQSIVQSLPKGTLKTIC